MGGGGLWATMVAVVEVAVVVCGATTVMRQWSRRDGDTGMRSRRCTAWAA